MISLRKNNKGFTIVELLIVIVVIGILALLVVTTYNGIQQKARNTKRQTDINAVHGQLEAYQAENGKYPTLANMQDVSWIGSNLKGLDLAALKDPKWSTTASCKDTATPPNAVLAGSTSANCYVYAVTSDTGGACDNGSTADCTKYTLTATYEGTVNGSSTYSKTSLN